MEVFMVQEHFQILIHHFRMMSITFLQANQDYGAGVNSFTKQYWNEYLADIVVINKAFS